MKLRLLLTLLLILVVTGCNPTTKEEDFIFSYEMDSIEDEDRDEVQRWLHEPDQTPTRTYEFINEDRGRHIVYAHSSKFSNVDVKQKGDAIIMMFKNEKIDGSGQDAFVKIKYNPDIIKNFVVDSDEAE